MGVEGGKHHRRCRFLEKPSGDYNEMKECTFLEVQALNTSL